MKRFTMLLAGAALLVALQVSAHEMHAANTKAAPSKTLTGEIVDTGCYLDHGAKGAGHVSCATKCLGNGMPMGLLTADGSLYLITLSHDNADPYNELKTMAGKTVSVTGRTFARSGMKAIEADSYKPMAAK